MDRTAMYMTSPVPPSSNPNLSSGIPGIPGIPAHGSPHFMASRAAGLPQSMAKGPLPQGSKLVGYMNRPFNPANSSQQQQQPQSHNGNNSNLLQPANNGNNVSSSIVTTGLKKLNLSGVQEFVPSTSLGSSSSTGSFDQQQRFCTTPTTTATASRPGLRHPNSATSPPPPQTPSTSLNSAANMSPTARQSPNPLMMSNDFQQQQHQQSVTDFSTFSDGGTTYFYNSDEIIPGQAPNGVNSGVSGTSNQHQHHQQHQQQNEVVEGSILMPDFQCYPGTPSHVANMKVRSNLPSFLEGNELKIEILKRQQIALAHVDPESQPNVPAEVDNFAKLCPLESQVQNTVHKSNTFGYFTTAYRATNMKSGLHVCLRRIHGFRLVNTKCMGLVEQWKELNHSNVVTLRQVFTTKSFNDHSMVFVYDLYPGAETLSAKHFNNPGQQMGTSAFTDPFSGTDGAARPYSQQKNQMLRQQAMLSQNGLLAESLIWNYVIQLTSALRHIHSAGLACRILDPSKILVVRKDRLLLNCGGIFDILTFDPSNSNPQAAMAHYQQEDLIQLGKVVLALACNSYHAIQRENLQTSMEIVTATYSSDLRNLIMYLLTNPNRVKSVNDLMPMIGARFYTQLDAANLRCDVIESELSKEVESTRLFRVLTKLCTIVDRAELNGDFGWAECGDRYMLKLFRDYVFHQVMEDSRPWLDMAHVIACLNKLDSGVSDQVCLMSRDEQNVLVVSYSELKHCLEQSFTECVHAQRQ